MLVPLLEAASLAEDETLAAKWAALLANATDPAADDVPPSFPGILGQLTVTEARVLDHFAQVANSRPAVQREMDVNLSHHGVIHTLGLDSATFAVSIENLYRQRLLTPRVQYETAGFGTDEIRPKGPPSSSLGAFGRAFLRACQRSGETP